jgi:phospholipid N-methyltransferase
MQAAADLQPQRPFTHQNLILQLPDYAVTLLTIRLTQGATIATVGKATGHVVRQLLSHCARNPECTPCEIARTKAETMQTMIAESKALKSIGAKRAGIRMSFS